MSNDPRCWVAVASAEHVRLGRRGGFMQVCHGKGGPLRRLRPGDRVAYYSPTVHFGAADRLQAFTALGQVRPGEPYQFDMGGGFIPFRRDVAWDADAAEAPIAPLLARLSFTAGRRSWGHALRFGLLEVTADDMALIEGAMRPGSPLQPGLLQTSLFASGREAGWRSRGEAIQSSVH